MRKTFAAGAALCAVATGAYAQDVFYWPAPVAYTVKTQMRSFPPGTPVMLTTRTQISTKDNRPGTRVYLRVAENLTYGNQIVLPAGALAVAEIVQSDENGHFGKKGKLALNLLYVQTPSGPVEISGESYKTGKSGTAASVATILLVSPLGFLIHGTSATIPYGTPVQAYLAQPLKFATNDEAAVSPGSWMPTPTAGQGGATGPGFSQ